MNTRVRARTRISEWCTGCHGLKDKYLIGRADEYEVIAELHKNLYGNILVGHDLQMEIRGLAIPTHTLLGIRDTAVAKVFDHMGLKKSNNGDFYALRSLALDILQEHIQVCVHTSWEDTMTLLRIYRKIEDRWKDTSPTSAAQMFKNSPPQTNGPPSSRAEEWLDANYWRMATALSDASLITSFHSAREDPDIQDEDLDIFAPLDDFGYELPPMNVNIHPLYVPTVEYEMPPPPHPDQLKVLSGSRVSVFERLTPKVI